VFPRNGKFNDPATQRSFNLRRLTFSTEPGQDGTKNLVLRQNPVLMDLDDDEKKFPLVLARNVRKFSVECWDTNQLVWVGAWDDTNAIPPLVRVKLVLGTTTDRSSGADVPVTRIMSMPSQTMPAFAQNGGGGAPGGAPGGLPNIQPPGGNPVTLPTSGRRGGKVIPR